MKSLSNIPNYKGDFSLDVEYEQFDFVYNPKDGLFYYAKNKTTKKSEDTAGDEQEELVLDSGSDRFILLPQSGEIFEGAPVFYIVDRNNNLEKYSLGLQISLSGSQYSDGRYKIIDIDRSYEYKLSNSDDIDFLLSSMGATELTDQNTFNSDWFLLGENEFEWKNQDWEAYVYAYEDLVNWYNRAGPVPDGLEATYGFWNYQDGEGSVRANSKSIAEFGESHWTNISPDDRALRIVPKKQTVDILYNKRLGKFQVSPYDEIGRGENELGIIFKKAGISFFTKKEWAGQDKILLKYQENGDSVVSESSYSLFKDQNIDFSSSGNQARECDISSDGLSMILRTNSSLIKYQRSTIEEDWSVHYTMEFDGSEFRYLCSSSDHRQIAILSYEDEYHTMENMVDLPMPSALIERYGDSVNGSRQFYMVASDEVIHSPSYHQETNASGHVTERYFNVAFGETTLSQITASVEIEKINEQREIESLGSNEDFHDYFTSFDTLSVWKTESQFVKIVCRDQKAFYIPVLFKEAIFYPSKLEEGISAEYYYLDKIKIRINQDADRFAYVSAQYLAKESVEYSSFTIETVASAYSDPAGLISEFTSPGWISFDRFEDPLYSENIRAAWKTFNQPASLSILKDIPSFVTVAGNLKIYSFDENSENWSLEKTIRRVVESNLHAQFSEDGGTFCFFEPRHACSSLYRNQYHSSLRKLSDSWWSNQKNYGDPDEESCIFLSSSPMQRIHVFEKGLSSWSKTFGIKQVQELALAYASFQLGYESHNTSEVEKYGIDFLEDDFHLPYLANAKVNHVFRDIFSSFSNKFVASDKAFSLGLVQYFDEDDNLDNNILMLAKKWSYQLGPTEASIGPNGSSYVSLSADGKQIFYVDSYHNIYNIKKGSGGWIDASKIVLSNDIKDHNNDYVDISLVKKTGDYEVDSRLKDGFGQILYVPDQEKLISFSTNTYKNKIEIFDYLSNEQKYDSNFVDLNDDDGFQDHQIKELSDGSLMLLVRSLSSQHISIKKNYNFYEDMFANKLWDAGVPSSVGLKVFHIKNTDEGYACDKREDQNAPPNLIDLSPSEEGGFYILRLYDDNIYRLSQYSTGVIINYNFGAPSGYLVCEKPTSVNDTGSLYFYETDLGQRYYIKNIQLLGVEKNSDSPIVTQKGGSSSSHDFDINSYQPETLTSGDTIIGGRLSVLGLTEDDSISQEEYLGQNEIILSTPVFQENENNLNIGGSDYFTDWTADEFFFDADYGSSLEFNCLSKKFSYGNGYYINQPMGINSVQVTANLLFKNRTNREANSLIHFIESHLFEENVNEDPNSLTKSKGLEGFAWGPSSAFHPYKGEGLSNKRFFCLDYSHNLRFENQNDISVKLQNFDTSLLNKSECLYVGGAKTYSDLDYYSKNDIVLFEKNHKYYYCISDEIIIGNDPAVQNESWSRGSGYFIDQNADVWTRDFVWRPSVGLSVNHKPRLNVLNLGGDYSQIYRDGDNEKLITLGLEFNNRTESEARAILHFLEHHYGCMPFNFSAPAPYDKSRNFICKKWKHVYNFNNNHTITATFEEFPFALTAGQYDSIVAPGSQKKGANINISKSILIDDPSSTIERNQPFRQRVYFKNDGDSDLRVEKMYVYNIYTPSHESGYVYQTGSVVLKTPLTKNYNEQFNIKLQIRDSNDVWQTVINENNAFSASEGSLSFLSQFNSIIQEKIIGKNMSDVKISLDEDDYEIVSFDHDIVLDNYANNHVINNLQSLGNFSPFDLLGADVSLSKVYSSGKDGGILFSKINSHTGEIKIEDGVENLYMQNNLFEIVNLKTKQVAKFQNHPWSRLVDRQFIEQNKTNVVPSGRTAYFDLYFDGNYNSLYLGALRDLMSSYEKVEVVTFGTLYILYEDLNSGSLNASVSLVKVKTTSV